MLKKQKYSAKTASSDDFHSSGSYVDTEDDNNITVEKDKYEIVQEDPDEWLKKNMLFNFLHKLCINELGNKEH